MVVVAVVVSVLVCLLVSLVAMQGAKRAAASPIESEEIRSKRYKTPPTDGETSASGEDMVSSNTALGVAEFLSIRLKLAPRNLPVERSTQGQGETNLRNESVRQLAEPKRVH